VTEKSHDDRLIPDLRSGWRTTVRQRSEGDSPSRVIKILPFHLNWMDLSDHFESVFRWLRNLMMNDWFLTSGQDGARQCDKGVKAIAHPELLRYYPFTLIEWICPIISNPLLGGW